MVTEVEKSYDPYFYERLFAVEDRHFWFRGRNELLRRITVQLLSGSPESASFLEVGCGTGVILKALTGHFPQMKTIGMDLFIEGLRLAARRSSAPLVQGDLYNPPFSCQFDFIGLFDVLEHISEDGQVLKALACLLKPGGYAILTVPASAALWSYFDVASCHVRRYEPDDLAKKISAAGLELEYISHYMMTLYPIVRLRRLLFSKRNDKTATVREMNTSAEEELSIIPVANEILFQLLRCENYFIRRRKQIPWGTSLIAIARKPGG